MIRLLILVVCFVVGYFVFPNWHTKPIKQMVKCRARVNLLTAEAGLFTWNDPEIADRTVYTGITAWVDGSCTSLAILDSVATQVGSNVSLIDISQQVPKDLGSVPEYPAKLSIQKYDDHLCRMLVRVEDSPGKRMRFPYDKRRPSHHGSPQYESVIKKTDTDEAVKLTFDPGTVFTVGFFDQSLIYSEQEIEDFPREFIIKRTYASEWGYRGQRLSQRAPHTAVFTIQSDSQNRSRRIADFTVIGDNVASTITKGTVSLGRLANTGSHVLKIPSLKEDFPIWGTRRDTLFHFAVSLDTLDDSLGLPSQLAMRGNVYALKLNALEGSIGIGDTKIDLSVVNDLVLEADTSEGGIDIALDFLSSQLPVVGIQGIATSIKINDVEQLDTWWGRFDPHIRGGAVGGVLGFVLSLILTIFPGSGTTSKSG